MSTRKAWQKEQAALARRVRASQRGAGFTLLEILVALAIFVIGAVAIIRIFPPALGVIQGSENRTIATNTSRDLLARLTSDPDKMPDSIYHVGNYDSTPDNEVVGAVSGTMIRNNSLPPTLRGTDFEDSALGNIRRVVGEKHSVLNDGTQRYVVTEYSHTGGPSDDPMSVFVEDTIVGARVTSTGELDFRNARLVEMNRAFNQRDYQYADDPDSPSDPSCPATPAVANCRHVVGGPEEPGPNAFEHESRIAPEEWRGPNTIYYVSYRWRVGTGRIQGVVDEPVFMPTTIPPADRRRVVMGRPGPAATIIDEEVSIRVKRAIRIYAVTPTAITEANSIRGYLPLTDSDSTDNDDVPVDLRTERNDDHSLVYDKVSVNYTVRDWRWLINYDSPAPMGVVNNRQAGIITLQHRNFDNEHLLDSQTTTDTGTTVYGLLTYRVGNETRFDTGQWNGESDPSNDGRILTDTSVAVAQRETDDYGVSRKGTIRYDISATPVATPPVAVTAPRARTAYWTGEGWAKQLSVAARSYIPYEAIRTGVEREAWREYYWAGSGGSSGLLYFPPTEAGKTVMVTFEYSTGGGNYNTKSAVYTISDERVAISNTASGVQGAARNAVGIVDPDPTVTPAGSRYYVSSLEIGDPESAGAPYPVTAILAVQGLSVQARTAWIEGDRYQQASATGYRPINQS